jgi:hypothetical protein
MTTDPKFVTLPNGTTGYGNWALQSGSPAIGAGVQLNSIFTTDILGTTRGAVWDMGAFQSMNPPTVAPSNVHTAITVH